MALQTYGVNPAEKLFTLHSVLATIKKFFAHLLRTIWSTYLQPTNIGKEAKQIVDGIKQRKLSSMYSHDNIVDTKHGFYRVDCSGFVNSILKNSLPTALQEVQEFVDNCNDIPKPIKLDPWPVHYVLFFKEGSTKRNWQIIENARLLQPGDIVAYYSENKKNLSSEQGQHIMIVADQVAEDKKHPSKIWVPIFDSTKTPHGKFDIREENGGIGQSLVGLEMDDKGTPVKLQWSPESITLLKRRFAMARISSI